MKLSNLLLFAVVVRVHSAAIAPTLGGPQDSSDELSLPSLPSPPPPLPEVPSFPGPPSLPGISPLDPGAQIPGLPVSPSPPDNAPSSPLEGLPTGLLSRNPVPQVPDASGSPILGLVSSLLKGLLPRSRIPEGPDIVIPYPPPMTPTKPPLDDDDLPGSVSGPGVPSSSSSVNTSSVNNHIDSPPVETTVTSDTQSPSSEDSGIPGRALALMPRACPISTGDAVYTPSIPEPPLESGSLDPPFPSSSADVAEYTDAPEAQSPRIPGDALALIPRAYPIPSGDADDSSCMPEAPLESSSLDPPFPSSSADVAECTDAPDTSEAQSPRIPGDAFTLIPRACPISSGDAVYTSTIPEAPLESGSLDPPSPLCSADVAECTDAPDTSEAQSPRIPGDALALIPRDKMTGPFEPSFPELLNRPRAPSTNSSTIHSAPASTTTTAASSTTTTTASVTSTSSSTHSSSSSSTPSSTATGSSSITTKITSSITTSTASSISKGTASSTGSISSSPLPSSIPISQCNTGSIQCCQSQMSSSSPEATSILGPLGVVLNDVLGLVGLDCSPITVIGLGSGAACINQPLCCQNDTLGTIALNCVPINIIL